MMSSNDPRPHALWPTPSRALIVEDDARLRGMISEYLARNGIDVTAVGSRTAASARLGRDSFEVIVLDPALPDGDGLDLCRDLRMRGIDIGVIILSARRSDIDRVSGLDGGADDYLVKPCNPRELLARIHAVLRRTATFTASRGRPTTPPLRLGRCTLDCASRVLHRDGESIHLSAAEFALLFALVSRPGQTLSRERLAKLTRGRSIGVQDRSIDMQIARLRKLVEDQPDQPKLLRTVWGVGYAFVQDGTGS